MGWQRRTAKRLGLEYTLQLRGRRGEKAASPFCSWFIVKGSTNPVPVSAGKTNRFGYTSEVPTVLRERGFEVRIYTRDHEPPHVHCWKGNGEIVIDLDPIGIREIQGLTKGNARRALAIVAAHERFLVAEWRRIHS